MGVSLISFPDCLPHLPGFNVSILQAFTPIVRYTTSQRGSIFTGGAFDLFFLLMSKGGEIRYTKIIPLQ
jgi:hypothetical protein